MRLRSLLFVPGDRPDRMAKALSLEADALILDLEDAVTPARKDEARTAIAEVLAAPRDHGVTLLVRINQLDSPFIAADLALVMRARPDALVLPKAEGEASIAVLDALAGDLPPILPIATETAKSVFALGSYAQVHSRLCGLTWGAEDLPAAIGATTSRDEANKLLPPYEMIRSLTLFAAHAADVPAIETVYPKISDNAGLAIYAAEAARDGFTGMMAIHPSQVPVINTAFTPTPTQIEHAHKILAAFAAQPTAGALQLDGKMIDAPHLKQAQSLLARLDRRPARANDAGA
ncbi:MAG: CoA ester lyase [Sphingomonas sp. 28-62-20]|uniref:HpcH/HpaI aldolase/citrate lyase family protein n=1 Tax=Sphingomonas sp. 28-62-20 TaxID=1970433 RepID=UPI000BCD53F9|nr:MAG: CoA ester lyase [Sphingomonas sp. 28-62-20]